MFCAKHHHAYVKVCIECHKESPAFKTVPPMPQDPLSTVHTRVMVTCVSESGGCSYHLDVGIPYGADPEVALKDRLSELRAGWHQVNYTTGVAA